PSAVPHKFRPPGRKLITPLLMKPQEHPVKMNRTTHLHNRQNLQLILNPQYNPNKYAKLHTLG
ncbi:MAG: hypothetical protein K1V67_05750, partial [Paramuribaculum intestinale]